LGGEFFSRPPSSNTMIKQLSVFTSEVTRVAREVVPKQARRPGPGPEVTGVWKDLTESVNSMANNLTGQVRNIAEVTIAVANGDPFQEDHRRRPRRILQLKEAINTMVDQLRSFASESPASPAKSALTESSAVRRSWPGVAGTWKDLTDSVNAMCGNLTAQVRAISPTSTTAVRARRPLAQDHGRRPRRNSGAQGHHQHDGRSAQLVRFRSDPRRARSRHEGKLADKPRSPAFAGTWKDLTDNVNFMASNLTPGPQYPPMSPPRSRVATFPRNHGHVSVRNPSVEGNAQHNGRPAQCVLPASHARRREVGTEAVGAARPTCSASPAPGRT